MHRSTRNNHHTKPYTQNTIPENITQNDAMHRSTRNNHHTKPYAQNTIFKQFHCAKHNTRKYHTERCNASFLQQHLRVLSGFAIIYMIIKIKGLRIKVRNNADFRKVILWKC